MHKVDPDKEPKGGQGICAYGPTNCGKTDSVLTLPGKTNFINLEDKSPLQVLSRDPTWKDRITVYEDFNGFDEIEELLNEWLNKAQKGTMEEENIFLDGGSFQQGKFRINLEDDHYERALEKSKGSKVSLIFDRFGMGSDTQPGYGALASMMKRVTANVQKFTKFGKNVIFTAWEMENPKYSGVGGESLDFGPTFEGKSYSNLLSGYFSLIGRIVEPWKLEVNEEGKETGKIIPPIISFVRDDAYGKYLCRATGKLAPKGKRVPLNWSKIIGFLNKEDNK
jgi:hypothetical protein